ncbi:MAG TPA: hypothetical protein VD971_04015 [Phycisphaerales bacterium]|nr:hypothetical protein [Phycisphaerales bacterium]
MTPARSLRARAGTVYVFVLASMTLILASALLAIDLGRRRLETLRFQRDAQRARSQTQSLFEQTLHYMNDDPDGSSWRSGNTGRYNSISLLGEPGVSQTVTLTDPGDGALKGVTTDNARLVVSTTAGDAYYAMSADLAVSSRAMNCLDYGLVVAGTRSGSSPVDYHGGTPSIVSNPASLAVISRTGGFGAGTHTYNHANGLAGNAGLAAPIPAGAVEVPDGTIIDWYTANGRTITLASLGGKIDKCLFSPSTSPSGAANARGIYVVDCAGSDVTISETRVYGTLVLKNAGSGSKFDKQNYLHSPDPTLPALIVQGSFTFDMDPGDLTEGGTTRNYNPAGAPFLGATDSDTADRYPCMIRGVVFITGNVTMKKTSSIRGCMIVGGNLTNSATAFLVSKRAPEELIPGFTVPSGLTLVPNSVKRQFN